MSTAKFEYFAPKTVEEASKLLLEKGKGAYLLAGGTDIMVKVNHDLIQPKAVIGLKKIEKLNRILYDKKKGLTIGATALLADVASHPDILKYYPAVAYAAQETANVQIRNMGTVGGNLCNAAPSADNAPALIAMGAQIIIGGIKGERKLPLEHFFKGPGLTSIEQGEVVTSIFVPLVPRRSGVSYQHISARGKVDISAVGIGAMVTMDGSICTRARIVMGAVGPIPMRAPRAEKMITGRELTPDLMAKAGIQAAKESKPISDVRASADYRRKMVAVLTTRALKEARTRARTRAV